ncbi:NAD(P)/FAD-dependent oxidoreductase [Paenibacillus sp. IB182496]|uniref:NAD(P)/FAD-dependent oxidoreductase n=1 Tax=Paenibacillus sabuli TaxID=2772509 RepID=A0A927GT11_9BACL|nr:NAD(P)/FAD-dependent oxidoreductase [Paenibacillus sabuli]MBD2847334.1 NAD(P)/FAD-dependent oxidoreductase [Paenibacillus sabuli]
MHDEYEVIIIGGGPSGLMAAIAASAAGARTALIDKGSKLGRKLGISGGGRCNVTNAMELDELIRHIPGNGRFLHSAFAEFDNRSIIRFFEGLGIALKEEDRGRMFPVSDKAKTVVDALVGRVRGQGVDILVNRPVAEVRYEEGRTAGVRLQDGTVLSAGAVVIATGGKSVPHTGSTGDGYPWAEQAGHTITELYPTEVPLTSDEAFIRSRELQGLSLRDVTLTVWNAKGKKIVMHEGDMLFTHFGLSGPAALRCSQYVVKALRAQAAKGGAPDVELSIDLRPGSDTDGVARDTLALAAAEPRKAIRNVLKAYYPERLVPLLLRRSGLDGDTTYANIPKQACRQLAELTKRLSIRIDGTRSLEEAFVTGGGVHLKEIEPRTMMSRRMPGLFFCGEVLDIHGYTGGYNITAAFTTGHAAGKHAALHALQEPAH